MKRQDVRAFILSALLIFIGSIALAQTEPAKTEPTSRGNKPDEMKTELKAELKDARTALVSQTTMADVAKTYSDGKVMYVNSKVLYKLTASDDFALDRIEYRIDDGAVTVYEKPFSITAEGPHTIKYYGIDKMGNKEAEKTYSVVVDNTGPVISVTASNPVKKVGDKYYFPKNTLFAVTAADALSGVSTIEYTTDGTNYKSYAAPFSLPESGELNLKVRAIDNVNNKTEQFAFRIVDESGKEVEIKDLSTKLAMDDVAPVVTIKSDKELKQINNQNAASSDVKYFIEASDAGSGVAAIQYRLDGKGDFIPYSGEIQFLSNGKHQIDARAIDRVGNVSGITTLTVYVDVIPPKSEIETVDK